MSILGNRVLRTEDDRFLRGKGQYVENIPLEGAETITFVRSLLAHAKINGDRHERRRGAPRRAGVHRRRHRPAAVRAAAAPRPEHADGPARDRERRRALRRRDPRVVVSEDRATGADAAELVMVDYDPLPVVVDPQEALKDETLLFPEAGTNVAAAHAAGRTCRGPLRRLRRRRLRHARQPADGAVPARAALDRGHVRGRQAHRLALHADPARGPRRRRRSARAGAGSDPRDRP